MTTVQIGIYVIFLCLEIIGVSAFMEYYKKIIRKDKAGILEIRGVGLACSIIAILLLVGIKIFQPVLSLIGAPLWADIGFYIIVFYFLQMQADLKIIKNLISSFLPILLKKAGIEDAQAKIIIEALNSAVDKNNTIVSNSSTSKEKSTSTEEYSC